MVGRDDQPESGDGKAGRNGVAERPVVADEAGYSALYIVLRSRHGLLAVHYLSINEIASPTGSSTPHNI